MNNYERKLLKQADVEQGQRREMFNDMSPSKCDLCGGGLERGMFFIDGALQDSMEWANMCPRCLSSRGQGVGWGTGQLYMKQPTGAWLMVAGFPPEEEEEW
jgi:hypothetical protein